MKYDHIDWMMDNIGKVIIAVVVFVIGVAMFSAKMESDTYNKLTGAHTTMWDALFVELRIQDKPQ